MVGLDAVVQNRYHDALSRVSLLPGRSDVHVKAILGTPVLPGREGNKKTQLVIVIES